MKKEVMKKILIYRYPLLMVLLLGIIFFELSYLENIQKITPTKNNFHYYRNMFDEIAKELKCFPVIKEGEAYPVTFEDSFGEERTYGGKRAHEGCDLMGEKNERGRYKICSMTDGIVTKIGWLEQGGWRIGIQSNSGVYYYYAHLDSYEKAFKIGEKVAAGQILGRMGDSGYGKEPGTKGKFNVHLHLGIYVKDIFGNEHAINPFGYLKMLER